MKETKPIKNVTIQIPKETHKKLKLICNIKGLTIKDYILKLLEKEIKQTDFNKLVNEELKKE